MTKINCFIPAESLSGVANMISELQANSSVEHIFLPKKLVAEAGEKARAFSFETLTGTSVVKRIAEASEEVDYVLLLTKVTSVKLGQFAMERMLEVAESTGAVKVYTDYYEVKEGKLATHPVIDYQEGSLRDDFDFGPLVLYKAEALRAAVKNMKLDFEYAGLYTLRLKVAQQGDLFRIPEYLYTVDETDTRKTGQKVFDYIDPKKRQMQVEMEQAVTEHLKDVGAWLSPDFTPVELKPSDFDKKLSVIIPVRNREKTIADAMESVLIQKTDFDFNLIVVDNHSTDKTTGIIKSIVEKDDRVIHIVPIRQDLGIGGCWNLAIHDSRCGMISMQLDSDDIYKDETTLQKVVDVFEKEKCAMVVGTYQLVNFDLQEIPPGIIDHKEWTPGNGKNNALRINGLGAPRAFYTPVLRDVKIPNTSYGEDYAVGLAISRNYKIGRIYDNIYLCRRWTDNSDAALDIVKMNTHNTYKDRIRTIELKVRQKQNKQVI
ncbi:glycosyltransferase family 2 protein [Mariniphaga sediminis]|uniref:Glycosyltransferase family 2 protein n=1 Tax=Mariniphaga sediminis TaxID=1628158 RepID=A0A399CZS5_9BACT|nr:glycosyltransferase family 2 protein [Mariniphaga sediminis]RIH64929.1 glycosyltransferase family 2 protein [Mariniphaga sediminis]